MRSMSVRVKFLTVTIGFVMLFGLVVVIMVQITLTQRFLAELQKRGVSITEGIAREAIRPILTEDMVSLQILVNDRKILDEDIAYIFVLDPQDEVLAHTFEDGFPIDLRSPSIVRSGRHGIRPLATAEGVVLDIAVPILRGDVGVVHVGISEEPIKKDVANIIRRITGIIIAVLTLGSGAAVLFATAITKPVCELAELAKTIGGGDLEQKVRFRTKDEIGQLGVAFNKMITERKKAEK